MALSTLVTYLLQQLLNKWGLGFLQTILFILVIAALVQMIEIVLKKISPALYQALGVFLPLITTNCCLLGVSIMVADGTYKLPEGTEPSMMIGLFFAIATAIGFALALVIFAGMREQLAMAKVPKAMQGTPIALLTAGLLAMAFMGFSGVV
jgi:electron transport complex protein RnfA